jgi:voltage-gated potassium channel Kch
MDYQAWETILNRINFLCIYVSTVLVPIDCFVFQQSHFSNVEVVNLSSDFIYLACSIIYMIKFSKSRVYSCFDVFLTLFLLAFSSCLITGDLSDKRLKIISVLRFLRYITCCAVNGKVQIFRNSLEKWLILTLVTFTQVINLLCCLWFFAGCPFTRPECVSDSWSWVSRDTDLDIHNSFSIWIRSMYFILQTLTTVGYGDIFVSISSEMVFVIFLMILGSVYNGLIISVVTSAMKSFNIAYILYLQEIHEVNKFSKLLGFSSGANSFVESLMDYKNNLFLKFLGISEVKLSQTLPNALLLQYKKDNLSPLLKLHPLLNVFRGLKVNELCEAGILLSLPKGFYAHFQSDIVSSVEIVREGSYSLHCNQIPNGTHLIIGDSIGEDGIIMRSRYENTFVTDSFMEIVSIPDKFVRRLFDRCQQKKGNDKEFSFLPQFLSLPIKSKELQALANVHHDRKNRKIAALITNENHPTSSGRSRLYSKEREGTFWIISNLVVLVICTFYCTRIPISFVSLLSCRNSQLLAVDCLSFLSPAIGTDYFCDFLYFVYFILRVTLCPVFIAEGGRFILERDFALIRREFLSFSSCRSSFLLFFRVLLLFPFDLLAVSTDYLWFYRLSKVFSVFLISSLLSEICVFVERFEVKLVYFNQTRLKEVFAVLEQLIFILISVVWFTSFWELTRYSSVASEWVSSFYWCLTTVTTTGYGDIIPNTSYSTSVSVVTMFLGSLLLSSVIAQFVNSVQG